MSIELKITGATPEAFQKNALGALLVLMGRSAAPAQRVAPAAQAPAETPAPETPAAAESAPTAAPGPAEAAQPETVAEPLENPSVAAGPVDPPAETTKRRPGRPRKQPETIAVEKQPDTAAAPAADPLPAPGQPEELNDAIPDFLQPPAEAPQPEAPPAKSLTLEDCRAAVRGIFAAFENREREARGVAKLSKAEAQKAEAAIMTDKVAYTVPLLAEFGVQKVSELKPDQYAAFVTRAQVYVEGKVG